MPRLKSGHKKYIKKNEYKSQMKVSENWKKKMAEWHLQSIDVLTKKNELYHKKQIVLGLYKIRQLICHCNEPNNLL
jgi:prenyltransferase beta subunit